MFIHQFIQFFSKLICQLNSQFLIALVCLLFFSLHKSSCITDISFFSLLSLSIYISYNFRIIFSIYLPSLSENIYLLHSDVTSIPHIFITHSYYRIKLILTTISQDNLSISKRRKVILICIIKLCYINVNPV